jgi:hypothetical protein
MDKKEIALNLIEDLIVLADFEDKEILRLKYKLGEKTNAEGQSALVFHLKSLRELIKTI